ERRLHDDAEPPRLDSLAVAANDERPGALGQHAGTGRPARLPAEELDRRAVLVDVAVHHQRHKLVALERAQEFAWSVLLRNAMDRELALRVPHRRRQPAVELHAGNR